MSCTHRLLAILALLLCNNAAAAQEPGSKPIKIKGYVQFWERLCENGSCGLPQATSEKFSVEGELPFPSQGQSISWFRTTVADPQSAMSVDIAIFWRIGTDPSYLVAQYEMKQGGVPRASCNQYHRDTYEMFYAAGFCSMWESSERQLGVSFYKI